MNKIAAHKNATPEMIVILEKHLNELAMDMLKENMPGWMYDEYINAHGDKPITVVADNSRGERE